MAITLALITLLTGSLFLYLFTSEHIKISPCVYTKVKIIESDYNKTLIERDNGLREIILGHYGKAGETIVIKDEGL